MNGRRYRGRLAPSPTGYLHLGHAATFWLAQERCLSHDGEMVLRVEDLDRERCHPEYASALIDDLHWYGLHWDEGPYVQSERMAFYLDAWRILAAAGAIYPCSCTRRDMERAARAPHVDEHDAVYPGTCRPSEPLPINLDQPGTVNWRLRTPTGETVSFEDGRAGRQEFRVGKDFGDFIVWRKDGVPAYQLAVVVDDAAMGITEVVRGEDLLPATAQQILLYRALGLAAPGFYHTPLVLGSDGRRLAKRTGAHSLRALREAGVNPATLRPEPSRV